MPMGVLAGMAQPNSSLGREEQFLSICSYFLESMSGNNNEPYTIDNVPTREAFLHEQMPMGVLAGMTQPNSSLGREEQFLSCTSCLIERMSTSIYGLPIGELIEVQERGDGQVTSRPLNSNPNPRTPNLKPRTMHRCRWGCWPG